MEHDNLPFLSRKHLGKQFAHGADFEIRLDVYANTTNTLRLTGFTREGPFEFKFQHSGDSTIENHNFGLSDIPISITIWTSQTSSFRGDVYIRAFLGINGEKHAALCQGYIHKMGSISWPHHIQQDNLDGRGLIVSHAGADPSAGAEAVITVPANATWRIKAFIATLVADATSTTRKVHLLITDGTNDLSHVIFGGSTGASETEIYSAVEIGQLVDNADGTTNTCTVPSELILPEGFTIETITDNLQAGDNWGVPRALVEQWLTP